MIKFENRYNLPAVDAFLRLYGELIEAKFAELQHPIPRPHIIEFLPLPDDENEYNDVVVRVSNRIYISEQQVGLMGFTEPELFAALCHELGHILYHTHPWAYDSEERADTLAAELGLGNQMISVIEKIIASRRFRNLTAALVHRIHFLQHLA
ncbi:MAG: hypothetical protein NC217_04120 [Muribaculaceae bacterium]|nr:hypothetical protein [Muribaculaceae bacterium]